MLNASDKNSHDFNSLNGGDIWCQQQLADIYAQSGIETTHQILHQMIIDQNLSLDADILLAGLLRINKIKLEQAVESASRALHELTKFNDERNRVKEAIDAERKLWIAARDSFTEISNALEPIVNLEEDRRYERFSHLRNKLIKELGPTKFINSPEQLRQNRSGFEKAILRFRNSSENIYFSKIKYKAMPRWSEYEIALTKLIDTQSNLDSLEINLTQLGQKTDAALNNYYQKRSSILNLLGDLPTASRYALFIILHQN